MEHIEDEGLLRKEAVCGESSFPLNEQSLDLQIRRSPRRGADGDKEQEENAWSNHMSEHEEEEAVGAFTSSLNDLSEKEQDVLKVAACLGSFDKRLLEVSSGLSEEVFSGYLEAASERGVIKENVNGVHVFSSDDTEKDIYGLIPPVERRRLHLTIGRNQVERLSNDELENHIYTVLRQFHCGMEDITSQSERNALAVLCLRATHIAVAAGDFLAACNYSEFGIQLLPPNHWKGEYDLSLALYNASAEVCHLAADHERADELVSAVLENACFHDTLVVRATRVHSLSSTNRMTEALSEGLGILRHLGEKFPSRPRKYHVAIEFLRTKRLLQGKTNELILRMPLMKIAGKVAAMQMLNLIFPVAYHMNRILFMLINLRLVRLTMKYGLSAISTVGFAAYSVMLVTVSQNKDEGFRYCQLALELLDKFRTKEYIPRVYYFVYGEALTFKYDVQKLYTYLLRAYQIGLESGDIEVRLTCGCN